MTTEPDESWWMAEPPPDPYHEQPPPVAVPVDRPSWARIDLTAYLDGSHVPQAPEMFRRSDGKCLLYRGRVHWFHGESESGKSWMALAEAAVQLRAGHPVLMLDFESDEATVVSRLLRLGVAPSAILASFDYRRPAVKPEAIAQEQAEWSALLGRSYRLAIIDGITEAFFLYDVQSKDNDSITGWVRTVARPLAARTGAALVCVDHVTKDADTRGRFAIGGQAKMAALDGAAYVVEVLEPLGVGLLGRVALRVAKDRLGGVRPHAGTYRKNDRTQEAAVVTVDSRDPDRTTVTVDPPRTDQADSVTADGAGTFRPTGQMQRASEALEKANGAGMSRTGLAAAIGGRKQYALMAIEALIAEGHVSPDGPRLQGHPSLVLIHPYRETDDTTPKTGTGRLVPLPSDRPVPVPLSSTGERGTGPDRLSTRSAGTSGNGSGTGRASA